MLIDQLWYKTAVIYCLDSDTFMDGNADGIGDFLGLRQRLSYLEGLGVTCLWLLPFYPTPNRDNGYDITDYYGIDPRLGDLGDFVEFSHEAKRRGLRIIIDLVLNHTSNEHPWFQEARKSKDSKYRDYYVWSETKPEDLHEGVVFPGHQETVWTYDEQAGAWYLHRFFPFQPDLNIANPAVRREMLKVIGTWLELGVSGFRVDAVPFLIEDKGVDGRYGYTREDGFRFLNEMRDFITWRQGDAILLAEANVTMEEVGDYFMDGRRMQLVFNFPANQQLFVGLVEEKATSLASTLRSAPTMGPMAQWAHFLRNHDELDLGRLKGKQRDRVFGALGPDPEMQIFDRGIRRRLAGMLNGDADRLHFCFALLLGLPGTPVIWYGEELGMVEELSLPERLAVRAPMQWSSERNGGFSAAEKPFRPLKSDGPAGYQRLNVARARRDANSLLNRVERLIRMRKECPEIGMGTCKVLDSTDESVLLLRYDLSGQCLLLAFNFARSPRTVKAELEGTQGGLICLMSGEHLEPKNGRFEISLDASGFRWLRLGTHDAAWSAPVPPADSA